MFIGGILFKDHFR